jgi:hypothetical protein
MSETALRIKTALTRHVILGVYRRWFRQPALNTGERCRGLYGSIPLHTATLTRDQGNDSARCVVLGWGTGRVRAPLVNGGQSLGVVTDERLIADTWLW